MSYFNRFPIAIGDEILINGASGAVGTSLIQIAKHFGAQVTGVCSGGNAKLVTSLGTDHVIDYTKQDFTANGKTYDMILDCVGNAPFERVKSLLKPSTSDKPSGILLLVIPDLKGILTAWYNSKKSGKRVTASQDDPTAKDLEFLVSLAEAGKLRPVIDRTYDLDQIAQAHRYVDTGRKKGNVVVKIGD